MSALNYASSKGFTSTPLKTKSSIPSSIPKSRSLESTGNSTYSLLSPIYHDRFELSSEDENEEQTPCQTAVKRPHTAHDVSSVGLLRNNTGSPDAQDPSAAMLNLSAWEQWLVSKAKEDRIKTQQKFLEEQVLKEKMDRKESEQQKKKAANASRIQEWLQMKKKQEKQDKLYKQTQSTKEMLHEEQKRMDIEKKAEEKYKAWLEKKKQEEKERKLKEQEETFRREILERKRKEKAERTFKEWLKSIKDKERQHQLSACSGGYDNLNYPAPGFVNPIPWKPIHIPQETRTPRKNKFLTHRKRTGQPCRQSTPCLSSKSKDTVSFVFKRR